MQHQRYRSRIVFEAKRQDEKEIDPGTYNNQRFDLTEAIRGILAELFHARFFRGLLQIFVERG